MALELRDPIHGFIHRERREQQIIDTAVFQRLRRLRQLALASLVYPGAVHTRFDHSIGALHVAGKICSKLFPADNSSCQLVRLAALLHDIGHGPFSHVSEPILEKYSTGISVNEDQQIHEIISAKIIETSKELNRFLSDAEAESLIGLLQGTAGYKLHKDIVSGPMDVDKQDYLLRDSYFCGVKYGVYDLERLSDTLRVHEDADDKYLALSPEGVHSLEQFVLAKYYMTTQAYRHRIRLITDAMIERGIRLGIDKDRVRWLRDLYTYDGSSEYVEDYARWNDDRLINKILDDSTPDGWAKRIFLMLMNRHLLKSIFETKVTASEFPDAVLRSQLSKPSEDFLSRIEKRVSEVFGFERELVIAYPLRFKSAAQTESDVIVLHPSGPRVFRDESVLFSSVNLSILEQYFHVFAPATYKDEKDRRKRRHEYYVGVSEILREIGKTEPKTGAKRRSK